MIDAGIPLAASSAADAPPDLSALSITSKALLLFAIRIAFLALLVYWTFVLLQPFLLILIWSVILTVALYPAFERAAATLGGRRKLAAAAITAISLLVMLGPAAWLGLSLAESTRWLIEQYREAGFAIPPPPESVKYWPLIGDKIYGLWLLAFSNARALLAEISPHLKPYGASILAAAGGVGIGIVKFVIAVVISGFLFVPGGKLVLAAKSILGRVATKRGEEFLTIAGATVRSVSRGVIGVAFLQALLAGIGFLVAGVPAAGLLSFLVLLLGIMQIGPTIVIVPVVIWYWFTRDAMPALLFTVYMVPVTLLDNVLRPLAIAHGLKTPMPVIFVGVVGGTIAHGLVGLFVGPVVLAIAWQLLVIWTRDEDATPGAV